MSNLHRILWIDGQIRGKQYPNSRKIALQFEISLRQAARDIEYLRYSLGAPLEYCQKNCGYYYTNEAFAIPSQYISVDERKVLGFLAYQYKKSGSDESLRLAELFTRLSGEELISGGSTSGIDVVRVRQNEALVFHMLKRAIEAGHKVEVQYVNMKGECSCRVLCPYKLFMREKLNYVAGYCEYRREIRVFRLDRVKEVKLTPDIFSVAPDFNPDNYGDTDDFAFADPYIAVVETGKPLNVSEFKLPASSSDCGMYKIEFYNSEELFSNLLAQTRHFRIASPGWLRRKLNERLARLIDINS